MIAHFVSAEATSPAKAVTFDPQRRFERKLVDEFKDKGILRPASNGGHYIVPDKLEAWQRERRKRTGLIFAGAMAIAAAAIGIAVAS
ncbi:hypothetical protein DVW87_08280 [Sphingomonas aracearum]|uniref:Uncharacterized protein n=1 Tax=Sphingomonas aracearum TaxID=2283317 RepID=A0A369VVQ9_9SPHN|nr:hypothetical protein DVW87_08280 [Sphingomonas aracearum]